MPPALIPDDESYDSEEDADFAPDDVPVQNEAESSEDEESDADTTDAVKKKSKGKKRKRGEEEAEDLGFENSGDEAIIDKGLKKRRKKGRVEDEDEGGEGGLVKTRSMRAAEKIERKPLATIDASTIDVNAIYQAMISGNPTPTPTPPPPSRSLGPTTQRSLQSARKSSSTPGTTLSDGPESLVMIKRTYTFAGKIHSEEKLVPRGSAEAQLYLSTLAKEKEKDKEKKASTPEEGAAPTPFTKPKRQLKKARRSIFEPIPPEGLPQRTDLHFGERKEESGVQLVEKATDGGKKLNTVEKSAMDWAGFVDKEGIKDELVLAGKSKGAYKSRQEFLARVERKKVEDDRRARGLPALL